MSLEPLQWLVVVVLALMALTYVVMPLYLGFFGDFKPKPVVTPPTDEDGRFDLSGGFSLKGGLRWVLLLSIVTSINLLFADNQTTPLRFVYGGVGVVCIGFALHALFQIDKGPASYNS